MKYQCVSSKAAGNRFNLVIGATSSNLALTIVPFKVGPIRVLSYRLYQAPKISAEKLRPSDCISRVPGIGALYARRFATVNIRTVADLAALDIEAMPKSHQWNLISSLRKNRGDMTVTRLQNYIVQVIFKWFMYMELNSDVITFRLARL